MLTNKLFYYETDEGSSTGSGEGSTETNQTNQIDWSTVKPEDIPENLIKATKLHDAVLKESIERRKVISGLKQQISGLDKSGDENKSPAPDNKDESPLDKVLERLAALEKSGQLSEVNAMRKLVGDKYGFTDEQRAFITGNTLEEIEASAKNITKAFGDGKHFGGSSTTPDAETEAKERTKRILTRVANHGMGEQANPFDSGYQKKLGGGI